jgi:hypothetical protein
MNKAPEISIIIPVHDRRDMLPTAVRSCARSAPGLSLQVIVIDDASTEDIATVAACLQVQYERLAEQSGSAVARNRGLALARGRYVKFLDSDDVLVAGALRREFDVAEASGADIAVAGWSVTRLHTDCHEETVATFVAPRFTSIPDDLLAGRAVPTSSALYATRVAQRATWDAQLAKLNDWDYFISAALCAERIVTVEGPSYFWRQHTGARITSSTTFMGNAAAFYAILSKLAERLEERGLLTIPRRKRLAQYLYKELRGLYRFRRQERHAILAHIQELDPHFWPCDEERSRLVRLGSRVLPLTWLFEGYGIVRRALDLVFPASTSGDCSRMRASGALIGSKT